MDNYEVEEIKVGEIELLPVFAMRDLKKTDIESLAASIKAQGLINPLVVRKKGKAYELISGHRRYQALKELKEKTAPARVIDVDDAHAFVIALTENMERKDPEPLEEAKAFCTAVDELHMKTEDIAKQINRSVSYVNTRMRLTELSPKVTKALEKKDLSVGHCEHFLKLNHEDQDLLLEDLEDMNADLKSASVEEAKGGAETLKRRRKKIEELAAYIEKNKDKIKFPTCPTCHEPPDPDSSYTQLKQNLFGCQHYHGSWSPFKKKKEVRQTDLDGGTSNKSPRGENVVKVEAAGHRSLLVPVKFFEKMAELIVKGEAVRSIKVDTHYNDRDMTIEITIPKSSIAGVPIGTFQAQDYKNSEHKTHIDVGHGNWGGDNAGTLKEREKLWKFEKTIDKKAEPAEIIRVALNRLVVNHKALSKGTILEVPKGKWEGSWKIKSVHRDYTVNVVESTVGGAMALDRFLEEPQLRELVKAAKKISGGRATLEQKVEPEEENDELLNEEDEEGDS